MPEPDYMRVTEGRASIIETAADVLGSLQAQVLNGGLPAGSDDGAVRQRFALFFGMMMAFVPDPVKDEIWHLIQKGPQ